MGMCYEIPEGPYLYDLFGETFIHVQLKGLPTFSFKGVPSAPPRLLGGIFAPCSLA